jgi:O-antigen/teichoic acid export membrane protein
LGVSGVNIKKVVRVICIDAITLFIGILNGFFLPKVLDINDFALIKTFTLYIGYAGMMHLGFSDGIYIILGGKTIKEVDRKKIVGYLNCLIKVAAIILTILIFIAIYIKDDIFNYFIAYTFPYQIILFFSLYERAIANFDKYVLVRGALNILNLITIIIVVFYFRSASSYIILQIAIQYIVAIYCIISLYKNYEGTEMVNLRGFLNIINIGFMVLLGNLNSNLILSIGRWIIKFKFDSIQFAYYSFSTSLLSLFVTLINSVTILFYPYLTKCNNDISYLEKMKINIISISMFCMSSFFILDFIVQKFLEKYYQSFDSFSILVCCVPFISVTSILYCNLYKINKLKKRYTIVTTKILLISLIVNIVLLIFYKKPITISIATFLTYIFWYIYSAKDFMLNIDFKEIVFIGILLGLFNLLKLFKINVIFAFAIYVIVFLIIECLFYGKNMKELVQFMVSKYNSRKGINLHSSLMNTGCDK